MAKTMPRVVLVTGAAGGIGRAMVAALLSAGHRIAALDYDAKGLSALLAERVIAIAAIERIVLAIAQDTVIKIAAQHVFNAGKPVIAIRMDNMLAERLWR